MSDRAPRQGKFQPKNPRKYKGDPSNVIYRSSWELLFMKWCDRNSSVLEWGSEELVIPYQNPVDNQMHRYFVDFNIKVRDKQGAEKRYFIEIKPARYVMPPKEQTRKTQRYLQEVETYVVNQAKWKAATEYASHTGAQFMVLTEHDLGLKAP